MAKKLLILVILLPLTAACASLSAEKPVENPALAVPAPPEKTVEPAPVEPQIPEPVPDLPPPPVTPPRPRPPQRDTTGSSANRDVAVKPPEPKPAEQTAPPVEATPPPTPAVPPLRVPATIDPEENKRQIRDTITRTNGMLSRIDYRVLSNERKKAYDDAKQFLEQAEGGLKESNLEFARNVAEKAEKLAKELQSR